MALGLLYRCRCGERFKVYLPKQKLFQPVTEGVVDWQALDAQEEADGEVDQLKRLADITGCTFVDGRDTEAISCPVCGQEIPFLHHFYSQVETPSNPARTPRRP